MIYDYRGAVMDDVRNTILDGDYDDVIYGSRNEEELFGKLSEMMSDDDYITGKDSHTDDVERIGMFLQGNESLIAEAVGDYDRAISDPVSADVAIRCHLLDDAIRSVLDERQTKMYVKDLIGKKYIQYGNAPERRDM